MCEQYLWEWWVEGGKYYGNLRLRHLEALQIPLTRHAEDFIKMRDSGWH